MHFRSWEGSVFVQMSRDQQIEIIVGQGTLRAYGIDFGCFFCGDSSLCCVEVVSRLKFF
jgi:hypothetical protein